MIEAMACARQAPYEARDLPPENSIALDNSGEQSTKNQDNQARKRKILECIPYTTVRMVAVIPLALAAVVISVVLKFWRQRSMFKGLVSFILSAPEPTGWVAPRTAKD